MNRGISYVVWPELLFRPTHLQRLAGLRNAVALSHFWSRKQKSIVIATRLCLLVLRCMCALAWRARVARQLRATMRMLIWGPAPSETGRFLGGARPRSQASRRYARRT